MLYYDQIDIKKEIERIIKRSQEWIKEHERLNWSQMYLKPILIFFFVFVGYFTLWLFLRHYKHGDLIFFCFNLIFIVGILLKNFYVKNIVDPIFNYSVDEMGKIYINQTKCIKKMQDFALNNDFEGVQYYIAYASMYSEDYDFALRILNKIEDNMSKTKGFFEAKAEANIGLKKYKEAIKNYEEAMRLSPEDQDLMLDYVDILVQEKEFKKTKDVLSSFKDKNSLAYLKLGGVCESLGELGEAADSYNKWLINNKKHPSAKALEKKLKYLKEQGDLKN